MVQSMSLHITDQDTRLSRLAAIPDEAADAALDLGYPPLPPVYPKPTCRFPAVANDDRFVTVGVPVLGCAPGDTPLDTRPVRCRGEVNARLVQAVAGLPAGFCLVVLGGGARIPESRCAPFRDLTPPVELSTSRSLGTGCRLPSAPTTRALTMRRYSPPSRGPMARCESCGGSWPSTSLLRAWSPTQRCGGTGPTAMPVGQRT